MFEFHCDDGNTLSGSNNSIYYEFLSCRVHVTSVDVMAKPLRASQGAHRRIHVTRRERLHNYKITTPEVSATTLRAIRAEQTRTNARKKKARKEEEEPGRSVPGRGTTGDAIRTRK